MNILPKSGLSRRALLLGGAGLALTAARPPTVWAEGSAATEYRLVAKKAGAPLVEAPHLKTEVWGYNGLVPGPTLRVRQGGRLRVAVENQLDEDTTVHWHGMRVPNAMDGVPHLTQKPIAPGETFTYEFAALDTGTYWYHPHQRGFEQVARGLAGPLIVEERDPPAVDRDVLWVLGDWRLTRQAQIAGGFGNAMEAGMAGRIGNTVTVNGRIPKSFAVRAGERIRLRLINAASARIFGLEFEGHAPKVIALDGHPVEPHDPRGGRIVLAPAQRVDLILDLTAEPGRRFRVIDSFYKGLEYRLLDLAYSDEPPLRASNSAFIGLPGNPVPEPDLRHAGRHEIVFGGGMMSMMSSAVMDGREVGMRDMMGHGMAWTVNGVVASGHVHEPALALSHGRSYVLALRNDSAWWHPIHLHGHTFRVVSRNGEPTRHREWQDTVLLAPKERADIAFVADSPGDWMIHCHVLEHQAAGMMATIRVA